jgi:nucleoside-diphosphate-sugar epimerase
MQLAGKVILVTGANGFVGSRISRRFAAAGAHVRALVRRPGEQEDLKGANIQEIEGDFTIPTTAVKATQGAHIVIHCAASASQDLEEARHVNTHGTRTIMLAAQAAECERFIHISTVSVYDLGNRKTIDETCPLTKTGHPYGISKAEGDLIVFDGMAQGLSAVIFRPSAILGVHPTSTWAVKVPERIRDGKMPLKIDGEDTLPYVHVENIVDAILLALDSKKATGNAYNLVDGNTTWRAYTDDVRSWFNAPPLPITPAEEVEAGTYWKGEYLARKIQDDLGYVAKLTYEDGMAEARDYWTQGE